MVPFVSAFAVFLLLHSIPAVPAVRSGIIARIGRPAYITVYSAASLAALGWLFSTALSLDYVPLWDLRPWHAVITFILAPLGGFLVIAGLVSTNPLSISIRSSDHVGSIVGITRHPVLWGFAIWALGHIAANGDLRSLLLFGGFALFALGSIPMTEKRARRRLGDRWDALAKNTSIMPFKAFISGRRPDWDVAMFAAAVIAAALGAWLLLGGGHALLFGADPIAIFD
jgi:uncharacterized membrane protein